MTAVTQSLQPRSRPQLLQLLQEELQESSFDNTKALDHDIFDKDGGPRHSGSVRRPTRDVASQIWQDAKPAEARKRKQQAKTKRKRKAKAMSMSQLTHRSGS